MGNASPDSELEPSIFAFRGPHRRVFTFASVERNPHDSTCAREFYCRPSIFFKVPELEIPRPIGARFLTQLPRGGEPPSRPAPRRELRAGLTVTVNPPRGGRECSQRREHPRAVRGRGGGRVSVGRSAFRRLFYPLFHVFMKVSGMSTSGRRRGIVLYAEGTE